MEVNLENLKKRVSEIRENNEKIKKYASIPDGEFWKDERNLLAIKHLLLQSIEASGSICTHILAKKFFKSSSSFPECFESLYNLNVISKDLAERLRKMARFRNILVHRYWEIEDEKYSDTQEITWGISISSWNRLLTILELNYNQKKKKSL